MMDGTMLCLISVESNLAELWIGNVLKRFNSIIVINLDLCLGDGKNTFS